MNYQCWVSWVIRSLLGNELFEQIYTKEFCELSKVK